MRISQGGGKRILKREREEGDLAGEEAFKSRRRSFADARFGFSPLRRSRQVRSELEISLGLARPRIWA